MEKSSTGAAPAAEVEERSFDAREPFVISIQSGGIRTCTVRYPMDKEWIDRQQKFRIMRRDLGRGKSKTDVVRTELLDQKLFQAILKEGGEDFDEFDASLVIGRLMRAEVIVPETDRGTDQSTFKMVVFGGIEVTVTLKDPRRKQVVEFNRASVDVTNERGGQQVKIFLAPAGELFDSLFLAASGYADASAIPIVHKDAVITELTQTQSPEA